MASMTRLRRRLKRWQRYADRTYDNPRVSHPTGVLILYRGHAQALGAVHRERERREVRNLYGDDPYAGYGPCFCLGCIGHGRCERADA